MDLLADLAKFKEEHGLEFLVIGGHAVNAHGYSRRTLDLDVLIPKTKADVWKQHVLAIGCTLLFEANNFIQFNAADEETWPLDFMLVNEETFSKLLKDAQPTVIHNVPVKVPSVLHIIALKLHVLKQGPRHRIFRDMDDVVNLIQRNQIDVESDSFKEYANVMGTLSFMQPFAAQDDKKQSQSEGSFLDLPDGSDFESKPLRLPIDQVYKASLEQLPLVNRDPEFKARRLRDMVDVPFEI